MIALFITPQFSFKKAIPATPVLYQMAFTEKLTKIEHDDTRAVVPAPKMYIMEFEFQDPLISEPWQDVPGMPVYKYIGIKESHAY